MKTLNAMIARLLLLLGLCVGLSACNGRPTYDIGVYDFKSNCGDENIMLRFEHDPEPELNSVKVEPAFEEIARAAGMTFSTEGSFIYVHFKSGVTCKFMPFAVPPICYAAEAAEPAACTASVDLYGFRYPSKGPGYAPAIAKEGEDYIPTRKSGGVFRKTNEN